MKKLGFILLIVCGLSAGAVSASARENERTGRPTFGFMGWRSLETDINHLNRMRGHVRWQLSNYRGGSRLRQEFAEISREIDQINADFRNKSGDRRHLRREIERVHARLHHLEVVLRVRSRDYYQWR